MQGRAIPLARALLQTGVASGIHQAGAAIMGDQQQQPTVDDPAANVLSDLEAATGRARLAGGRATII